MRIEVKCDKSGIRYVRPYLGTDRGTGKPIRPYKRFPEARTDEEAAELASEWLAEVAPAAAEGSVNRVGNLLLRYVAGMEEDGSPANTVRTYRSLIRHTRSISSLAAQDVRPLHLERMYRQLMKSRDEGGSGLDNNTVILLHNFLSGAFNWMAHVGVVDANPVRDARKPSPVKREGSVFDGSEFERLSRMLEEASVSSDVMTREAAFGGLVALYTGLRAGEVCALRKMDVQPALCRILVRGTMVEKGGLHRQASTKGKRHRAVSVSGGIMELIRAHEQTLAGLGVVRVGKSPLVTVDGGFMRPSKLSCGFGDLCRKHGMVGYKFHSLRHTHATQLIMAGIDIKTVSERLGHASVSTTLKEYAHVLPGRDAQAAEAFAELARGGAAW